ncbi:MAG: helix-turn-helix transcriptional regulator [Dysgonamonadaceae bacterium]|nr:helix-turn-helix transcriptional regulator [Dysgonamonadaceae bacterium]MDD4246644.1 helix-turn-helix transcriptional regulator [Dysgonamonadaceae bacterium]MDD4605566.1 helix-turn-helix transcriptional regulator [Dysgonamonadaceae bacterium]HTN68025.1 helix-turn-helix transcriptional regulator [Dysgonamonadaceae bacterium]
MKLKAIIVRGNNGTYDVNLEYSNKVTFGLFGQGDRVDEAIADFYNSRDEMQAHYKEIGKKFPDNLDFEFKYDVASFLEYYSNKFTLAGLQTITGINQGQLSHYVTGRKKPRQETIQKIEDGIHRFAKELSQVSFV